MSTTKVYVVSVCKIDGHFEVDGELCGVFTTFKRAKNAYITYCENNDIEPQKVYDTDKEYGNILCHTLNEEYEEQGCIFIDKTLLDENY